ncbi:hypothetical protein AB9C79_22580, partial [Escherichia coli]
SIMAESGYGLAGLGMGKVKSISPYRLTPGFGGFTHDVFLLWFQNGEVRGPRVSVGGAFRF